MALQSSLFLILYLLVLRVAALDCTGLLSLQLPNVSFTDAVYLAAGTTFNTSADPTCFQPNYTNTAAICRLSGVFNTSSTSSVKFEMWLPNTWYGRVLTGGNFGLGGCVNYPNIDQGAALNFASISTNNGHDGTFDPLPFLMPSRIESVTDFAYRAVEVAAVLGKKIAAAYYGAESHHSYYNGCSAGGRQGISVASRNPDLFDGILVGSPAIDWNRFIGAPAIWAFYVAVNTSSAIPLPLWDSVVAPEVLKQCDAIDGKVDGIINDPSLCSWNPDTLLCGPGQNTTTCLIQHQIDGLKRFYQPILGTKGELVFAAYEPGAEADISLEFPQNGIVSPATVDWFNYAIYGQPTRPANITIADIEYSDTVDPVGISTWSNAVEGLGKFRNKGGKVITFHGSRDAVVPSRHSKQFHDLVSSGLSSSKEGSLDDFYRFFMIPGMGHCFYGPGAWKFGQSALGVSTNQTDHSALLSLVEWTEGGNAPDVIVGTDDQGQEWNHCLWPKSKTVWNGTSWNCVDA